MRVHILIFARVECVGNHLRDTLVQFVFLVSVPVDGDGSRFTSSVRTMPDCRN